MNAELTNTATRSRKVEPVAQLTTIEFEAYCADNFVHDIPGIKLPCNEMKYNEAGDYDGHEDEFIHILTFKDEAVFTKKFEKWLDRVAQAAWSVSGDDDYFDYYPGNFDAARAIVEQMPNHPTIQSAVEFAENFAIAVRYGVSGMMDGLLQMGEDEALARYGYIMGKKIFNAAHEFADQIAATGGYYFTQYPYNQKKFQGTTRGELAKGRNKGAELRGIPKNLVPYSKKELDYFRKKEA